MNFSLYEGMIALNCCFATTAKVLRELHYYGEIFFVIVQFDRRRVYLVPSSYITILVQALAHFDFREMGQKELQRRIRKDLAL